MDGLIVWLTAISWWKNYLTIKIHIIVHLKRMVQIFERWTYNLYPFWFSPLDTSCLYLMFFFNLFLGIERKINGFMWSYPYEQRKPRWRGFGPPSSMWVYVCPSFLNGSDLWDPALDGLDMSLMIVMMLWLLTFFFSFWVGLGWAELILKNLNLFEFAYSV